MGAARSRGQGWPEATRRAWPCPRRGRCQVVREQERAGSCCLLRSGIGAGAQRPLVLDWRGHAERGVPPVSVVVLDPGGHRPAALGFGGEVLEAPELELQGGVPGLDDGIVQRRADPAHRLSDPDPGAGGAEGPGGVLAALVGVQDHAGPGLPPAADSDRHRQRGVGQLAVVVLAEGEADDPPRAHVQNAVQDELALVGVDLGGRRIIKKKNLLGGEVAADQVRRPPPAPAPAGGLLAPPRRPNDEALLAHQRGDGVLADPLPGLAQVGGDPRGAVAAVMLGEQPGDLGGQADPPGMPRRGIAVPPLVEPRGANLQCPARGRIRDAVLLPLGGDEGGHRYRPIASSTQRATERLRTSRCTRSSLSPRRSRASSARSSSVSAALPPSRSRRAFTTQLPRVPSLTPSSRATCAIGLPVSNTSRTAPCLKSSSNFRYDLVIATPQRRGLHATRGSPFRSVYGSSRGTATGRCSPTRRVSKIAPTTDACGGLASADAGASLMPVDEVAVQPRRLAVRTCGWCGGPIAVKAAGRLPKWCSAILSAACVGALSSRDLRAVGHPGRRALGGGGLPPPPGPVEPGRCYSRNPAVTSTTAGSTPATSLSWPPR